MTVLDRLAPWRRHGGTVMTLGLSDQRITDLVGRFPELDAALRAAEAAYPELKQEFAELLDLDEAEQVRRVQAGYVNFYDPDTVNPYVALTARGPWIVTLKGRVVHDSGGYGMLGFGHTPDAVLEAMARPQVMANVMTPNLSQLRFERALRREIGQRRGGCPYARFITMNSGSEAMTVAGRIADINTKIHTDLGGRHAGKKVKRIAVRGAFHGRTELPALYSDSSRKAYAQHLASHRHHQQQLLTVPSNDLDALRAVFAEAEREGWYIEAMFLEPVMGEGNPGWATQPEFYALARELTLAHGTLLVIDSIQAGLRAHGVLSVVDYPGFERLPAPDLESYSKALNAGQYPLSVLALNERAASLYRVGVYGNTMTTNPRALDVGTAVLKAITPELRRNIVERGAEALQRLEQLRQRLPGLITRVQGTGLLFSCELAPELKCYGRGSIEEDLRRHGFGVIHGGANSLRFTPHFQVSSEELELLMTGVYESLTRAPRCVLPQAANG